MDLTLTQKQGLSPAVQASMQLLQMNNLQLRAYISDLMQTNPMVELECPEIDFRPNPFSRGGARRTAHLSDQQEDEGDAAPEQAEELSPLHDLFLQSGALRLSDREARILRYIILSLDENGFLTETAQESADILHVSAEEVRHGIALLQAMEPAGVGAADLSQCLQLQLRRMTPASELAVAIAAGYLDELAAEQYGAIAKALHAGRAEVEEACTLIRSLHPKPLNGLGVRSDSRYILPDFYITEEDGQLRLIMNDYYLPKIVIDPSYKKMLESGGLSREDADYISRHYKEAADVIGFIDYRKSTMQSVMEYILKAQRAFFTRGPGHRTAMTGAEIAQALALSESTISRAVTGKFFECKWGVFPLRYLFSHRINESDTDQVLARLQALIDAEPEGGAYSDQQLAEKLTGEGVQIARRTVVKYRQRLGIPTSRTRNAQKKKP